MTRDSTLYVIRHGENPANINREFSYKLVDYSLTPKGVQQAVATAAHFRHHELHAIYSSPLKRAVETAAIIAEPHRLPVLIVEEFRENNVGILEAQPPTDENWALHDRIIADWYAGRHDATFPGGEDFHTLRERIRVGVRTVLQERQAGQKIVVVAHGGVLSGLVRGICHEPDLGQLSQRPCHNCSISEFTARLHDDEPLVRLRHWALADHLA